MPVCTVSIVLSCCARAPPIPCPGCSRYVSFLFFTILSSLGLYLPWLHFSFERCSSWVFHLRSFLGWQLYEVDFPFLHSGTSHYPIKSSPNLTFLKARRFLIQQNGQKKSFAIWQAHVTCKKVLHLQQLPRISAPQDKKHSVCTYGIMLDIKTTI